MAPPTEIAAADLDRLPALRAVASASVGYDHLPLAEASRRGIWMSNVPDYCVEEMADHSISLLLSLLRGVVVLDRHVRAGGWDSTAAGPLPRLRDVTLGVVGLGRIGRQVARRGRRLGMRVLGHDPAVTADQARAFGAQWVELPELLCRSDALSLHVALSTRTRHLIDAAALALLPPGAVLVDTARAGLVDMDALASALRSGHLRAAAFDVLPQEPPSPRDPLLRVPNLVINPHAGWYSPRTEKLVYGRAASSLAQSLRGRRPRGALAGPGMEPPAA